MAKVLVALAGVFFACWLPYATALIYTNWFWPKPQGADNGRPVRQLVTVAALLLGHAHSAVNPVAYWWLNRHTLRACPWCLSSGGDQFDDDDDDDGTGDGFGCGAVLAFGCGGGACSSSGSGGGGGVDCGGSHKCGSGCRQSHSHTPTRLNRLLFRQSNNHQRSRQPSSTNEAALGPFNPRFATPKKRPQQLPVVKNPVVLYYA